MTGRSVWSEVMFVLALAVAWGGPAAIWGEEAKLPEGFGLSAKYPLDRGIGDDPAVLLFEDFEKGELADLGRRWQSVSNKDSKVLFWSDDAPVAAAGKRSLRMTATVGENEGGHLYKKLPRGVDRGFARFYVKFPEDAGYIHHFVHFGGYRPATDWPQGGREAGRAATSG
jgi:hypothetical protein